MSKILDTINSPTDLKSLSPAALEELAEELRKDIEQFKAKLIEKVLAEKEPPERIYQVTMNYFPLSKRKKRELL